MEATLTSLSYRYRAPIRYIAFIALFLCVGGIAAFFFAVVKPWIFRAVFIFIMAIGFGGGFAFLGVYLRSLSGQVIFSQDTVILPYKHKRHPVVLAYSEISLTEEMHTYGRLLKISAPHGREYLLDESWMQRGRFDEIIDLFKGKSVY